MNRALIIGGGVAGPVAAMALQRAGLDAVVYEAYPRGAEDVGAFLTLASNGLDALRAVDAHHLVLAAGFDTPRMTFQSGTGKVLGTIPNGGALPDGTVSQTIKRADLYRVLRDEAVRRGARIEHGKRLVDAETTVEGGVLARFADGSHASGDLLVGADGIHSRTRTVIDPAAPAPRYVPVLNIGGYARGVAVAAEPGTFHMVFGRRGFFGYTVHPSGEVWWFANPPRAQESSRAELAAITDGQWRAPLEDLFARDRAPAREIIRATPGELTGWATYDLPSVATWHSGAMVVIGDAAHATSPASGQGASMTIEDAVVLAQCLRDLPSVRQAFVAYEQLRRQRVERLVAQGAKSSNSKAAGPVARVIRDLMLPRMLAKAAKGGDGSLAWMHDFHIEWDAPVTRASQPA